MPALSSISFAAGAFWQACFTVSASFWFRYFSLADGVVLTQKDIREVQLAKGAIRTDFKVLLKKFGLEDSDIEQVLLAGAFGNYIRPQSALRIGLLPDVPVERIHFVGNAASSGAQMILLSRQCRKRAKQLAHKIEYIEIANDPDFQTVFAAISQVINICLDLSIIFC